MNHFSVTKYNDNEQITKIFTYKDEKIIELLANKFIISAKSISPNKVLLMCAIDENINDLSKVAIKIFEVDINVLLDVIEVEYFKDEMFDNQIIIHEVYGKQFLFSIKIKQDGYDSEFALFDNDGNRLFDFPIIKGNSAESTYFEPNNRGFGIIYSRLQKEIKIENDIIGIKESLIDRFGNFYGDYYKINGSNPSLGIKSYTKYPRFIDGKILALRFLDEKKETYLTLINTEGKKIETQYRCPWVNTIYLKNMLIEDKKYFGKKCLVVIDDNNFVQLIDFDGNIIKELFSVEYQGIDRLYAKFFIEQSLNK